MADLTVPAGATATVANVADLWQELVGAAPTQTASSPSEQTITMALHGSYYQCLTALTSRGYSVAQVQSALGGSLLVPHIYVSFCATLHADIELDASRKQVVEWWCEQWAAALNGAVRLYSSSDVLIEPDPDDAASAIQAEVADRNGSLGSGHDRQFDWFYGQMHGDSSIFETIFGDRYGNARGGADS